MCLAADGAFELVGNRTECGLLQMATALGADYEAIRREGSVLRMFPFSSERKRMTSVVAQPGSRSALTLVTLTTLKFPIPTAPATCSH